MSTTPMTIGNKYRFRTYAAINGRSLFDATIVGITNGKFLPGDSQAEIIHPNMYAAMPESIRLNYRDDYTSYSYYQVNTTDDDFLYIGVPWVESSSIETLEVSQLSVTITDPESRDPQELSRLLTNNGYIVGTIEELSA